MMPGAPYTDADRLEASKLVERIGLLNEDRLKQEAAGDSAAAVRDAVLITDLVADATPAVLRAALVWLTSPETRPQLPVIVKAPCLCGAGGAR